MLTLRYRILILYASAPEGFGATCGELKKKFNTGHVIYRALEALQKKGLIVRINREYQAGPALKQELGMGE